MRGRSSVHVALPADMQFDGFFRDDGQFLDVMRETRWRIIREFTRARSAPGRYATPNCVAGCDGKPSSLVAYLRRSMKRQVQNAIFSAEDLPVRFRRGAKWEQEAVASTVRDEIFLRTVLIMKDDEHSLWYYNGEWSLCQSALDEYLLAFEKAAKANFYNMRRFHGRSGDWRKRTKRLRVAPGMSVG